jgi:hypothetical protein
MDKRPSESQGEAFGDHREVGLRRRSVECSGIGRDRDMDNRSRIRARYSWESKVMDTATQRALTVWLSCTQYGISNSPNVSSSEIQTI